MALTLLAVAISALAAYLSGPWWGAPSTRRQRLAAGGLTLLLGAASSVVLRHAVDVWWIAPMVALLAVVAVVDAVHQIIPNRLVALTAVWAVAARGYYGHWLDAALVAAGVFVFYLAVHLITRGGLGMGDVKFSAVLGLALGYPDGLVGVVLGMWAAGLYALFVLIVRRRQRNQFMALGPFLALGGLVGLVLMLHA